MKKYCFTAAPVIMITLLCSLILVPAAYATNGMNMEGYGPIATGLGGASMAYDNGTAAVMNNPATLGLMPEGNRLDVAFGTLSPHITTKDNAGNSANSTADLFMMPAMGWAHKSGAITYGAGLFAQGGMGTEYDANSFLAYGSGDKVRSELGVGRFIVPLVFSASPDLNIAVSADFVWASLDLKMAVPGVQLAQMVTGCSSVGPVGTGCDALPGLAGAPWTRLDFSGGGDMNGAAKGTGFAGKIGATYRISPELVVGATYHSKTNLSDLHTETSGATLSAAGAGTVGTGQIKVVDFQWPDTYGVGVAWNTSKSLMLVFDVKRINWNGVMKDFKMTYEGPLAGASTATLNLVMPQNWKNQTVYEIGAAYQITSALVGRIGVNLSDNPIPDGNINYLFPATVKDHYTIGAGYAFNKTNSIDASFVYAPAVDATNLMSNYTTTHSQTNTQIMYSLRF